MEYKHYKNQSFVFVKSLKDAKIGVKDGGLYIYADEIDFGDEEYQNKKFKDGIKDY